MLKGREKAIAFGAGLGLLAVLLAELEVFRVFDIGFGNSGEVIE